MGDDILIFMSFLKMLVFSASMLLIDIVVVRKCRSFGHALYLTFFFFQIKMSTGLSYFVFFFYLQFLFANFTWIIFAEQIIVCLFCNVVVCYG